MNLFVSLFVDVGGGIFFSFFETNEQDIVRWDIF